MLKTIDPLINADVLHAIAAMGHGDTIAIVDGNFPGDSIARRTTFGKLLRIDSPSVARAGAAILQLFPLDTFIAHPALAMAVVDDPEAEPAVQTEFQAAIDAAEGPQFRLKRIERFAFYDAARTAYAVVQTLESRPYGCFLLTKGVIFA